MQQTQRHVVLVYDESMARVSVGDPISAEAISVAEERTWSDVDQWAFGPDALRDLALERTVRTRLADRVGVAGNELPCVTLAPIGAHVTRNRNGESSSRPPTFTRQRSFSKTVAMFDTARVMHR